MFKGLFRKPCSHSFTAKTRSNALQLDGIGYPLRLFICKCEKCGVYDQMWIDVPKEEVKELDSGASVLVQWEDDQ